MPGCPEKPNARSPSWNSAGRPASSRASTRAAAGSSRFVTAVAHERIALRQVSRQARRPRYASPSSPRTPSGVAPIPPPAACTGSARPVRCRAPGTPSARAVAVSATSASKLGSCDAPVSRSPGAAAEQHQTLGPFASLRQSPALGERPEVPESDPPALEVIFDESEVLGRVMLDDGERLDEIGHRGESLGDRRRGRRREGRFDRTAEIRRGHGGETHRPRGEELLDRRARGVRPRCRANDFRGRRSAAAARRRSRR